MYGMFTYTSYRKNDQPTVLVNYSDSYPNDPMGISQVTGFCPGDRAIGGETFIGPGALGRGMLTALL